MVRIKPVASEEDIKNAATSEVSKLNLGVPGLGMWVDKSGDKSCKLRIRYREQGKKKEKTIQIGKLSNMTLAQAQKEAKEHQANLEKEKKDMKIATVRNAVARTKHEEEVDFNPNFQGMEYPGYLSANTGQFSRENSKRKKNESNYPPTFRSMEDAGQFIRNLFERDVGLAEEMKWALYLLILIPSRPNELLCAQWNEFGCIFLQFTDLKQWTIKQGQVNPKNSKWIPPQGAFLSARAVSALDDLSRLQLTGNGDGSNPIFPKLSILSKPIRDKEIAKAIKIIWPNYHIESDGFRYFFRVMSIKYSYFAPELIDAIVEHFAGNESDYNYRNFVQQMHALANWWADELARFSQNQAVPYRRSIWDDTYAPPLMDDSGHANQSPYSTETVRSATPYNQQHLASTKSLTQSYSLQDVMNWCSLGLEEIQNATEYRDSTKILSMQSDKITAQFRDAYRIEISFYAENNEKLGIHTSCNCGKQRCEHSAIVLLHPLYERSRQII